MADHSGADKVVTLPVLGTFKQEADEAYAAAAITGDTQVASGDKLVITDSSDGSKIKRSGIALGSSTSTFLRNDGTWAEPSGDGESGYAVTTVTLTANGWSNNSQTVNVSGVSASSTIISSPDPSSAVDCSAVGIVCSAQGNGTLTFSCVNTPIVAIVMNVMILKSFVSYTETSATLTAAGWSSNAQTVNVSGVTASSDVVVSSAPANVTDYTNAGVICIGVDAGTMTFSCNKTPIADITVNIMIFGQ